MNRKYFIFGGSSYIAKKFIAKISKKNNVICFSGKKKEAGIFNRKVKYIKTTYTTKHINQCLKKNINKNKKNIFLFFNGVSENKAFYKLSNNDITKIIKINYIQPVIITQCILKSYFLYKPTFIYFSSSRAIKGDRGISIYGSSKNAIKSFVKSMSLEYGELGINFRVVLLGLFKGGLNDKLTLEQRENIFKRSAIKNYVSINQLIKLINFIIDDHSGNGSSIKCDNGYF
jgi:3-oxoacyl-[acyl-carrier protein] reductase